MRTSSAVKNDLSGRKLSTVRPAPQSQAPLFDRQRLVSELLSLGNDRLRPELAQQIGEEVEAELKRRANPNLSPELISEIVQFKLEELGLIEIRRRRAKAATRPEEEPTVTLYPDAEILPEPALEAKPSSGALAAKISAAQLPTLEKFLQPRGAAPSGRPLPPKAGVKLSPRALRRMREVFGLDDPQLAARLEALYDEIATLAARAEAQTPGAHEPEILAVEFFNAMANQEFYPQLPVLFQFLEGPDSPPRRWGPTALRWRMDAETLPALLDEAAALWRRDGEVVFALEAPKSGAPSATDALERFFAGVEGRLMALPDEQALPASVALRLAADHPDAAALAELALSGRYYPKFRFEWRVPEEDVGLSALENVLLVTWKKSEPSLVCFDKASGARANSRLSHLEAGHPGGTPALSRYEGGSLGSLNLSIVGAGDDVDWAKLRRMTRTAVHFLDNLFEVAAAGAESPRETPRRLGLGVMGFAELLLKLGVPYDSEDAVVLAEKIFRFLRQEAQAAAAALAERREPSAEGAVEIAPRHEALLAIRAETGLADLAEVSPGLESLEAVVEDGRPLALLQQIAQRRRVWNETIAEEVLERQSVREAEAAPRPLRRLFAKRAEIAPEWPLKILGAAQRHCDLPMTGELELPEALTFETLSELLRAARGYGLRQVRIAGEHHFLPKASIPEATEAETSPLAAEAAEASLVLSLEDLAAAEDEGVSDEAAASDAASLAAEDAPALEPEASVSETADSPEPAADSLAASILGVADPASGAAPGIRPRPRPEVLQASNRLIHTGCGPMHVSFARDARGPYEVRAQLGPTGTCASAQTETISRLLSLCLSSGVDQRLVYEQLRGVRCPKSAVDRGDKILSCSDGIARVFERELGFAGRAPEAVEEEEEITAVTDLASLQ